MTLMEGALEDVQEMVKLFDEVLLPDYLDEAGADWDLLVTLRFIQRRFGAMCLTVAEHNRRKIADAWVGAPMQRAPLGPDLSPGPEG